MTTRAASVATSRALLGAWGISAFRPAASATEATSASVAASRWKGEALVPARSLARVSTIPTRAQASVRPNATAVGGAMPPGTARRQPDDDTRHRERKEDDLQQREPPEGVGARHGQRATTGGLSTSPGHAPSSSAP